MLTVLTEPKDLDLCNQTLSCASALGTRLCCYKDIASQKHMAMERYPICMITWPHS